MAHQRNQALTVNSCKGFFRWGNTKNATRGRAVQPFRFEVHLSPPPCPLRIDWALSLRVYEESSPAHPIPLIHFFSCAFTFSGHPKLSLCRPRLIKFPAPALTFLTTLDRAFSARFCPQCAVTQRIPEKGAPYEANDRHPACGASPPAFSGRLPT